MELVILKQHCLVCGEILDCSNKRSVLDTTTLSDKPLYKFIGEGLVEYKLKFLKSYIVPIFQKVFSGRNSKR